MIRAMQSEKVEIIEESEEAEIRGARERLQHFDRNAEWLDTHIIELGDKHRGRYICIAGQEAFIADTVKEAIALATAAHPEDRGWFTRYIPRKKVPRIYAV